MRAYRPFIAIVSAACVVLGLGVGPARAMTSNSELDGDGHPEVVALLFVQDGEGLPFCTGTVIRDTVVLTASHCIDYALEMSAPYPDVTFAVTNDPELPDGGDDGWFAMSDLMAGSTQPVAQGGLILNPAYRNIRDDVSVVSLQNGIASADAGTWPRIPTAGLLSTLSRAALKSLPMTLLGYGSEAKVAPAKDGGSFAATNERRIATLYATTMDQATIHQSQKVVKGEQGTCYGDSGGPTLVTIDGVEYVVAVTSTGDGPCWSTNVVSRVDRPEALDFLEEYL